MAAMPGTMENVRFSFGSIQNDVPGPRRNTAQAHTAYAKSREHPIIRDSAPQAATSPPQRYFMMGGQPVFLLPQVGPESTHGPRQSPLPYGGGRHSQNVAMPLSSFPPPPLPKHSTVDGMNQNCLVAALWPPIEAADSYNVSAQSRSQSANNVVAASLRPQARPPPMLNSTPLQRSDPTIPPRDTSRGDARTNFATSISVVQPANTFSMAQTASRASLGYHGTSCRKPGEETVISRDRCPIPASLSNGALISSNASDEKADTKPFHVVQEAPNSTNVSKCIPENPEVTTTLITTTPIAKPMISPPQKTHMQTDNMYDHQIPAGEADPPGTRSQASEPRPPANHGPNAPTQRPQKGPLTAVEDPVDAIFRDGVCWKFMHAMCDRHAMECRYVHPPLEQCHKYVRKRDEICRAYQTNRCHLGPRCRYIHEKQNNTKINSEQCVRQTLPAIDAKSSKATILSSPVKDEKNELYGASEKPGIMVEASSEPHSSTSSEATSTTVDSTPPVEMVAPPPGPTREPPTIHNSLSTTKTPNDRACINFINGRCHRGHNCSRFHPPREELHKYIQKGKEICRDFQRGSCPRGIKCPYIHSPPSDAGPSKTDTNPQEKSPKEEDQATISPGLNKIGINSIPHGDKENAVPVKSDKSKSGRPVQTMDSRVPKRPSLKDGDAKDSGVVSISSNQSKNAQVSVIGQRTAPKSNDMISTSELHNARSKPLSTTHNGSPSPLTSNPPQDSRTLSAKPKTTHAPDEQLSKTPIHETSNGPDRNLDKTPSGVCLDHLMGKCTRTACRYLHAKHANEKNVTTLPAVLKAQSRPCQEVGCTLPNKTAETIGLSSAVPDLPPGLGLEMKKKSDSMPHTDTMTFKVFDSAEVTLGPGFQVKCLKTGFESRAVILSVPANTPVEAIKNMLSPFGDVVDVQKDEGKTVARAHFKEYEHASRAVAALDGASVFDKPLEIKLATHKSTSYGKGFLYDGDVVLRFPPPCRSAFVGYDNRKLAEDAMNTASTTYIPGAKIFGEIHEGIPRVGAVTVRFRGLPAIWKAGELARFGANQGVMLEAPNYSRLRPALEALQEALEQFGELDVLNVFSDPSPRGFMRAWAHFGSPEVANRVCANLNGRKPRFLGNGKLYANHERTLKYRLSPDTYNAIHVDIRLLRSRFCSKEHQCAIVTMDKHEPIYVKLVAEQMSVLTELKGLFEAILRGDVLKENGVPIWEALFSRSKGGEVLQELQKQYPGVLIDRSTRHRTIAVLGPPHLRRLVKNDIMDLVKRLREQKSQTFHLNYQLIPLFMNADLAKLQEELGHENLVFDLDKRTLTVRGNEDAYKVVRLAILHARQRGGTRRKHRHNTCPVCFDDPTPPITLSCGHTWCKSCLCDYLNASADNRMFPLHCLGDEARCSQPILLEVAREILSPKDFDAVMQATATAYVEARPSEFRYCPTPDCPQIYRTAPRDTVLQCPSCLVRICPNCHVEYHEGSFCPDVEKEDQLLFEEWSKEHDVKNCPCCKAPIERIAGCNHMTCTRCKTHICWVCLQTFPNTHDVYDHMHDMHGGIGL